MDELDDLLVDLAREEVPAESLARVAVGVKARLRRRALTKYVLAAAAMLLLYLWLPRPEQEVPLPKAMEAVFPAPHLVLPRPQNLPAKVSSRRQARGVAEGGALVPGVKKPRVIAETMVELTSSDPNVVILWDLSGTENGNGGLQ